MPMRGIRTDARNLPARNLVTLSDPCRQCCRDFQLSSSPLWIAMALTGLEKNSAQDPWEAFVVVDIETCRTLLCLTLLLLKLCVLLRCSGTLVPGCTRDFVQLRVSEETELPLPCCKPSGGTTSETHSQKSAPFGGAGVVSWEIPCWAGTPALLLHLIRCQPRRVV